MDGKKKRLRIVSLEAENFKRLEAVEIVPSGDMVVVTGANAAGKSSVVDSIFAALKARAILKEIPQPVREGQDKATITLDLGGYVVVRTITPDGKTSLKVTTGEGVPVKSPQAAIDGLLGSLSIDPSVFIRLKAGDQVKTLVELVDTDGFLAKNDAQNDAWYNHRTSVGHVRDQHKAVLDANPKPDLPDVKPDVDALKLELAAARDIETRRSNAMRDKEIYAREIDKTVDQIAELKHQLAERQAALAEIASAIKGLVPSADPDALQVEYEVAVQDLAEYDKVDTWNAASEAHTEAVADYDKATNNLQALKINRQNWLAKATLPVDGLGFDFEAPCVTYNGLPLQQASSSEQLKVGTAIAMAQNPELRVIRVSDGNCLDKASFAMLADMAAENEFQLWIEKVDETGDIGFYIEDGKVVAVDGEPVEK